MKKQIILLVIVLLAIPIFAQEDVADYKKFETLAKKVNDIQLSANGKRFKNGDTDIQVSIPSMNFIFNYGTLSASWIFGNGNQLGVFENLNLADVNSIFLSDDGQFGDTGLIAIDFPQKQKATLVDGEKVTHNEIEGIPFYFSAKETTNGNEMFHALVELIYLCKVKKGKLTEQQAQQQQQKWKETQQVNTANAYYDFLTSYPNTIFTQHIYNKVESLDEAFDLIKANTNGFYLGMAKSEFTKIIQDKINFQKSSGKKNSKNFKLFLDNFQVQYHQQNGYDLYKIGNWYKTYYTDMTIYSDAGEAKWIARPELEKIERKIYLSTTSLKEQIKKLNLSYNKTNKLEDIIENYEYAMGNVERTTMHSSLFPYAKYASLADIVFENDVAKEITYSFVIYDDNMSNDTALNFVRSHFSLPFQEKKVDRNGHRSGNEGKVLYYDKGRYYVVASVRRQYNSEGWLYTPLFATVTFIVK